MANEEFNLSVLENVTTVGAPLSECVAYATIFGLIKEEVDISQTEDESEYQKDEKTSPCGAKRRESESCSSEPVFKSPYKKRNSLKLKSPNLLFGAHERKSHEKAKINVGENKTRSLGRSKPKRSFLANRRRCRSTSQSEISAFSDYGDDSTAETSKNSWKNVICTVSGVKRRIVHSSNLDDENSVSSKDESTSLATTDPLDVGTANESFVESSQNMATSSELRQRLSLRHSTTEIKPTTTAIKDSQCNSIETDEECQNYTLTLSPESKSSSSALKKEASPSPPRLRKRKAICRVSPLKGFSREVENSNVKSAQNASSPLRLKRRKVSANSPLKDLTQELESCILNDDYVEMVDSEAESMSFTFETIQLLNEYEDCDQQANNMILDKILSSPTSNTREKTQAIVSNVVSNVEQSVEDPLHIDYSRANGDVPRSTSATKGRTTKVRKASKKSSTTAKAPAREKKRSGKVQPNEEPLRMNDSVTNEDVLPSTSKRNGSSTKRVYKKLSVTKTPRRDTKRSSDVQSNEDSLDINETATETGVPSAKSSEKRITTKTLIGSNRRSTAAPSSCERRSSSRLKDKERVNMSIPDSDSDDDLPADAAKIVEDIAAAKAKAALSKEILNKLRNLTIRLRHEVLPQHEIESSAGTSALLYMQQKEFLEYAPLNKATYSPEEDEIIKENWNNFCEDHDWDPNDYKPFVLLKHGSRLIMSSLEERRKFVQFLANGLPNRPLCSVYSRFRRLYNKYDLAGMRYTKGEDEQIIEYMKCRSNKPPEARCSELAKVMNRSRVSIWKRYTKLVSKNCTIEERKRVLTNVEWDLPLVENFITTLLDVTLSYELIDLKNAFLPRVVWLKMEEKMKINFDVMQRFWEQKLHLQLFAPEPIFMNEIRIKLIEYMRMKKIRNSKEIKWDMVVKCFDGYTIPFLRYTFNHLTLNASLTVKTRDFSEIMQWLHDRKINELRFSVKDKCLPRITYKDKTAELVADDLARVRLLSERSDND